jgi:MFS family permease
LIVYVITITLKGNNPYIFPGLETRLFWGAVVSGLATFVAYAEDIFDVLRTMIRFPKYRKKPKTRKPKKRHVPEYGKKGIDLEYKLFMLKTFFISKIKELQYDYRTNKKDFFLFIIFSLSFVYVIYHVFTNLSNLIYSILYFLLWYILFSIKYEIDSRIPIALALLLLVMTAISLAQGFEQRANDLAIYAYYGLVAGVAIQFVEYMRDKDNDIIENTTKQHQSERARKSRSRADARRSAGSRASGKKRKSHSRRTR